MSSFMAWESQVAKLLKLQVSYSHMQKSDQPWGKHILMMSRFIFLGQKAGRYPKIWLYIYGYFGQILFVPYIYGFHIFGLFWGFLFFGTCTSTVHLHHGAYGRPLRPQKTGFHAEIGDNMPWLLPFSIRKRGNGKYPKIRSKWSFKWEYNL